MLRDTAKTASLSSEKGARFCLSPLTATFSPRSTLSHLPPFISALRRALRNRHIHFPRANVSMDSRSGKGAFMGSRIHAASTEKGLPTTHFAVSLLRLASHTLDDSPVTLLTQYIAEHFTCPLPIIAQYIRHTKRCIGLASLWLSGVRFGAVPPHFLARARVRQFRKKPSLLHLPSQTIENKRFRGEGFTPFLPSPLPSPLSMTSHGTTFCCAACMKDE